MFVALFADIAGTHGRIRRNKNTFGGDSDAEQAERVFIPLKEIVMSRKMSLVGILAAALVATLGVQDAQAKNKPGRSCQYFLGESTGTTAEATITSTELRIEILGAERKTLYTVWIDFRHRDPAFLAPDYPNLAENPVLDLSHSGEGIGRGVAPAFATTAPVFAGMGIDLNGVVTNALGNARLRISLDYNLLETGTGPVVAADLVEQGPNRVGGGWLRIYTEPLSSGASLQKVDESSGLPMIYRSTVQGLTIVGHNDFVTHGHTPGDGSDRFSGFSGNFPPDCIER